MTYTDHSLSGYVLPQDGGWSGVTDNEAGWTNAAMLGALALSDDVNYAPVGLGVTPDYANDTVTVENGLVFIKDNTDIQFRTYQDTVDTRSGTWSDPFQTVTAVPTNGSLPLEAPSGVNHIWVYYTHSSNNDAYIRISDTDGDEPVDPSLKIAKVDAGAQSVGLLNRGGSGGTDYSWDYLGKKEQTTFTQKWNLQVPDTSYDEYKIKFVRTLGTSPSSGSGSVLYTQFSDVSGSYYYRTFGNTNQGASRIKLVQVKSDTVPVQGHISVETHKSLLTFHNSLKGNEEKQMAKSGVARKPETLPFDKLTLWYSNGDIKGEINFYGRNVR